MSNISSKLAIRSSYSGLLVSSLTSSICAKCVTNQQIAKQPRSLGITDSGIFAVTSLLSALKYLPSLKVIFLWAVETAGIKIYMKPINNKPSIWKKVVLWSKKKSAKGNSISPIKSDNKVSFLSLEKNLDIYLPHCFILVSMILSITHKQLILPVILAYLSLFSVNNSYAAANISTCASAISKYETLYRIPQGLLSAMGNVESSHNAYALSVAGTAYTFKDSSAAAKMITTLIAENKTNFDVGCMQINYFWHGKHFVSASSMLDVNSNVRYAASFLFGLYKTHGSWLKAVRHYHSHDPKIHKTYSKKVAIAWLKNS